MTTAAELFALQEVDLALDKAVARFADIEGALVESEELINARQDVEERRRAVAEFRSQQSDLEWSVDEARSKASEVERKLYGGTVRNPKELSDLQQDLQGLLAQLRKREDTLLGLLVEIEDAESRLAQAAAVCAEIEATWQAGQEELRREKAELEPEIARLEAARAAEESGKNKSVLGLYQLLRERRAGQAVAKVERGMCQGCRISLPMSVLQKARASGGLVQCVSCERILLVS